MAKKYSYWLTSGKYSMLQKMTVVFFGVFSFMLLARALPRELLGVWGLFVIISSIVETSRNSLIKNAYILFIHTKDKEDQPGIEYAGILTNVIFSIGFILVFLVLGNLLESLFNSPGLATLLRYYCLTLVLLIPLSFIEVFLVARSNFKSVFWMYFMRNGSMFAIVAFCYFLKVPLSLTILAIAFGICAFIGLVTGYIMFRNYGRLHIQRKTGIVPQFIGFGKFVFGNNLFSLVFRSTDSFMIASFISAGASALYTTSTRIANLVDMPSQVLGDIMFPRAAQIMKTNDKNGIKLIYEKSVAATLTFTIPVILVILVFPKLILLILAGKQYVEASFILQVIAMYGLFLPFIKQFGNIMDVLGRPRVNFILMAIFAAINISLNLAGIHFFGLYGAAYGTLTSYILLLITTQVILWSELKISMFNIFRNTFAFYPDYIQIIRNSLRNLFGMSYGK